MEIYPFLHLISILIAIWSPDKTFIKDLCVDVKREQIKIGLSIFFFSIGDSNALK